MSPRRKVREGDTITIHEDEDREAKVLRVHPGGQVDATLTGEVADGRPIRPFISEGEGRGQWSR